MHRLNIVDPLDIGQVAAPDPECAVDPMHPRRLEIRRHLRQRIGVEQRITAPRQHQIALDDPLAYPGP